GGWREGGGGGGWGGGREGGEADTAGDHPRFRRRLHQRERTAERAETIDAVTGLGVVDQPGGRADALAENRYRDRGATTVAQDLEDGKRPPQERVEPDPWLQHHDVAGEGARRDRGRVERENVVVARQSPVRDHAGRHVDRHGPPVYRFAVRALRMLQTDRTSADHVHSDVQPLMAAR